MNPIKRLFKRFKKSNLRERVEAAYGTEFVYNIYDKMNEGVPVGNLVETIIYLEMIERIRSELNG